MYLLLCTAPTITREAMAMHKKTAMRKQIHTKLVIKSEIRVYKGIVQMETRKIKKEKQEARERGRKWKRENETGRLKTVVDSSIGSIVIELA